MNKEKIYKISAPLLFTFYFLLIPFPALAQSMPSAAEQMAHQFQGMEMGALHGILFKKEKDKKVPQAGQTVAIIVFQNGQRILMLNKKTDAEGNFQFKNIFKDTSYSYELGAVIENKLYVIKNLKLDPKQDSLHVDFEIGENSPYWTGESPAMTAPQADRNENAGALPGNMPTQAGEETGTFSAGAFGSNSYQKAALVLAGIVIGAAVILALKSRRKV